MRLAPALAEDPAVASNLFRTSRGLLRVVGELDGAAAGRCRDLADQRDGVEIGPAIGRAAAKIIGEIGAPAEAELNAIVEARMELLDRVDFQPVRENQQLLL